MRAELERPWTGRGTDSLHFTGGRERCNDARRVYGSRCPRERVPSRFFHLVKMTSNGEAMTPYSSVIVSSLSYLHILFLQGLPDSGIDGCPGELDETVLELTGQRLPLQPVMQRWRETAAAF